MNQKKIILSCLLLCVSCCAFAQQKTNINDTVIKSSTIEITQIYQPKIKEIQKQEYNPSLPPADNSTNNFTYEVPSHALNYSYKPLPLQPLSMGIDTLPKGFDNYIKLGLGNLRTIYLDAGIGAIKSKYFNSVIHLGLLSQKGEFKYQKQTLGTLNAIGVYQKNNLRSDFKLNVSHNNFYQYGYDEVAMPNKIANDQTLTGASLSAKLNEIENNKMGFRSEAFVSAAYYTGSNINGENSFGGGIAALKSFTENWTAKAGIEGMATTIKTPIYSVNNNFVGLNLGAIYDVEKFYFKAFVKPTIGQSGKKYLLSDIAVKFRFPAAQFNMSAGMEASLTQNTYQQLFQSNPYLSFFTSNQTHTTEVFALFEKGFGHHLSFSAKGSWWQYENLPVFLNAKPDQEKMFVRYLPNVNAISLQLGMRYQVANNIAVNGQMTLYKYSNLGLNNQVWHTPTTRLYGDVRWSPIPKLSISAYLAFLGGNTALDTAANPIKLNPILDMGFGAEYVAMKKLSLFLNFNNLLNNKYQRWQGYQAYGINIYGGLRFKF